MKITVETVFLWTDAPVCTVAKYSVQESRSKPTAKYGNTCLSAAFLLHSTSLIPPKANEAMMQRSEADWKVYITLSYSFCGNGQWHCKDTPCPGKCQVYGNGHYQTFDSKWYRFNGHCQYTLVEVRPNMKVGLKSAAYVSLLKLCGPPLHCL